LTFANLHTNSHTR